LAVRLVEHLDGLSVLQLAAQLEFLMDDLMEFPSGLLLGLLTADSKALSSDKM
jgi:hypothetical protein